MSAIYGAVIGARNALYDRGTFRASRLQRPVVSIGNISVGGTGKTPFTLLLGGLLKQRGISFDVLSRGYRRQTTGVRVVDPLGAPEDFGDEPLLMARRLGVPVVVGERRYDAGIEAERQFATQLHLLDDGFQHRQLARDFDIVLLSPEDVGGRLLPSGQLREPLTALQRANAMVVPYQMDHAPLHVRADQQLWRMKRGMALPSASSRPVAFCGIAKPATFYSQLRQLGIQPVAEVTFRDHHRYTQADVQRLKKSAQEKGADGFVTTAKDQINLDQFATELQPLAIAEVTMELLDPASAVDFLLARIGIRA